MEKSRLEQALDIYEAEFGHKYPLVITDDRSEEEIIQEIGDCVMNHTPKEEPSFDPDVDY